jgi:hypothetical protein
MIVDLKSYRMNLVFWNCFFSLSFSLFVISDLTAERVYQPKLVNCKNGEHHDFPMGVLEATGRLKEREEQPILPVSRQVTEL